MANPDDKAQGPILPEPQKYGGRSEEDLKELAKEIGFGVPGRYAGYQYVAEPAEGHDRKGLWLNFFAHHRTGYATVGHALGYVIANVLRLPMQLVPHRMQDIPYEDLPEDRRDLIESWMRHAVGLSEMLVCVNPPMIAAQMHNFAKYIVAYSTHEHDRVSSSTADLCNTRPSALQGMTKVWVKSPFAMKAFLEAGVREERLRLVRPPLVGGPWPRQSDGWWGSPVSVDHPFVFGMLGTWIARKGLHDLVRAYHLAFRADDPVVLALSVSLLDGGRDLYDLKQIIQTDVTAIRADLGLQPPFPRLRFDLGTARTDAELIAWLARLDCFANSSFGEGLGVPQIWALAAGVPIVSTTFGAVGDLPIDWTEAHALVSHRLEPIDREMLKISRIYDREQRWGRWDPEEYGQAMWRVFDRGRMRCPRTAMAVGHVHGFEECAPAIKEALAEFVDVDALL